MYRYLANQGTILLTVVLIQATLLHHMVCGTRVAGNEQNSSQLFVGNRTVRNAWQSSSWEKTCFYGRDASKEDGIVSSSWSYHYFHSRDKSNAKNGYHWFLLELNSTLHVTAVRIYGRNDNPSSDAQMVFNRATDIEIWVSATLIDFTEVNHCSASNISELFNGSIDQWTLCGKTKNENITKGENLTVYCTKLLTAKMLLFRKSVEKVNSLDDNYMSFAGITLLLGEPNKSSSSEAPYLIIIAILIAMALAVGVCLLTTIKRRKFQAVTETLISYPLGNEYRPCQLDEGPSIIASKSTVAEVEASQSDTSATLDKELNTDCDYATVLVNANAFSGSRLDLCCSWTGSRHDSEITLYLSITGDDDCDPNSGLLTGGDKS